MAAKVGNTQSVVQSSTRRSWQSSKNGLKRSSSQGNGLTVFFVSKPDRYEQYCVRRREAHLLFIARQSAASASVCTFGTLMQNGIGH